MIDAVRVEALEPADFEDAVPGLAALIVDAVDSGSSVNFMAGVTQADAAAWWTARADAVASGMTTIFVARDGDGRIVGCTLLARAPNPNSPHRAEIGKVIVHQAARRRGLGGALMRAAEERARADGRWLLMLDTVRDSPAARLYESLDWHKAGDIPNFAYEPDGRLIATTYYWKDLR